MIKKPNIICIGSILWDVIGRAQTPMHQGSDMPGHITRLPGGVAMNIAMTLKKYDLNPKILSTVGQDFEGLALVRAAKSMGLDTSYLHHSSELPTDQYMAIEASNGLIAAIADAHSLEAAGDLILQPLQDGRLGSIKDPFKGIIALDGNLTQKLLSEIATAPYLALADFRVAPASPGKAERLGVLLTHQGATLYVNVEEAEILCKQTFKDAKSAALSLISEGAHRVVVTHGALETAMADSNGCITSVPPSVKALRVTGAGDTFMAAHIAAEIIGQNPKLALNTACDYASLYVSHSQEK